MYIVCGVLESSKFALKTNARHPKDHIFPQNSEHQLLNIEVAVAEWPLSDIMRHKRPNIERTECIDSVKHEMSPYENQFSRLNFGRTSRELELSYDLISSPTSSSILSYSIYIVCLQTHSLHLTWNTRLYDSNEKINEVVVNTGERSFAQNCDWLMYVDTFHTIKYVANHRNMSCTTPVIGKWSSNHQTNINKHPDARVVVWSYFLLLHVPYYLWSLAIDETSEGVALLTMKFRTSSPTCPF